MSKSPSLTLAVIGIVLVAGPALADTRKEAERDKPFTQAEFIEHHAKRFAHLDTDGDGAVTKAELAEHAAQREAERKSRMQQKQQERFAKADTDQDGRLSRAEFDAVGERMFKHLDRNADGTITSDERVRRHGPREGRNK